MSYTESAFRAVCKDAVWNDAEWYVCLIERGRAYLGPWEGGTWGDDTRCVAFQMFASEELARKAAAAVQKMADELSAESRTEHGRQCLREMAWLEARGLDADFLIEPDGPTDYYVWVGQEIPEPSYASRSYE